MIARVDSFVLQGIDAVPCELEVDLSPVGLPKQTIVGLPDAAVRESIERVRTALLNSGFRFPQTRMTINLAPADLRKEGPVYDLPISLAILLADGTVGPPDGMSPDPADYLIAGEVALDGRVRPVNGVISLALLAKRMKRRGVIVPLDNASEAAAVDSLVVIGVRNLGEVVGFLNGRLEIDPTPPVDAERRLADVVPEVDFADIRGQEAAKRAMTIAAAGGHNVLMIGPAGTGKTMMAKALPGILPPLTRDEALEVTRIYSSVGMVPRGESLMTRRPVRTPHHTASAPAIVGGGPIPRPGDVSLAHRGVLFLDELPEFNRAVLETLREPLEDGAITIARAQGSVRFPARFMLVAAMNPSPRGDFARDDASQRDMDRYLRRLSGPLIDRIDIHIEVPAVPFKQLTGQARGTDTATMRERVAKCRAIQAARQTGTVVDDEGNRSAEPALTEAGAARESPGAVGSKRDTRGGALHTARAHGPAGAMHPPKARRGGRAFHLNAELRGKALDRHASLDDASKALMEQAMRELGLSARAYDKIRRVARTIADLEESPAIRLHHVSEAVQYRLLDRMK